MAECIERTNLIARIRYYLEHTPVNCGEHYAYSVALKEVLNCPATDVAPVVHGRWIHTGQYGEYECSVCHGIDVDCSDYYGSHVVTEQDYCPYCGSRMDGDDDE